MNPLLTLTTAFALLTGYFEWLVETNDANSQPALQAIVEARVVRDTPIEDLAAVTAPESIPEANQPGTPTQQSDPLNLRLPTFSFDSAPINYSGKNVSNLFKPTKNQGVSYDAELVYDLDRGEDITGGKLNITIPFG